MKAGEDALGADRLLCREDPLYWIEHYGWVVNPKDPDPEQREVPFELWPGQVELVRRAQQAKREQSTLVVNKGRELGISWLMLYLIAHSWMFEDGFAAHLGSRKEDLVDNKTLDSLFGKLRFILEHQPPHLLQRSDYEDTTARLLNRRTGAEITGESTNESWGRSGRKTVLLLDEFAHVDPGLQDRIWTGIESVAGCKWVVSTPNGKGNKFHFLCLMLPESKRISLDWRTDPRRDDAWFAARLIDNGGDLSWDEREQEHACSFAGVSGHRIFRFDRAKIEYTDPDLPEPARLRWTLACGMDFGSGPSLTVLLGGCVDWGDPPGAAPAGLWIDTEQYWERNPAHVIAREAVDRLREYKAGKAIVGDPAGKNKESDQESWESNLQAAGLPVFCLPPDYNEHFMIQKTLDEVQTGFTRGWLRIHRERCPVLLEACESWEWDLPRGIPLTLVNKAQIHPKKDQWSHFGDALRYLVGFALRQLRPVVTSSKVDPERAPLGAAQTIAAQLAAMRDDEESGGGWPQP